MIFRNLEHTCFVYLALSFVSIRQEGRGICKVKQFTGKNTMFYVKSNGDIDDKLTENIMNKALFALM